MWPYHPFMSLLHLAGDHHRVEGLEGVACTQRGRVGLLRLNPCRSNQNDNNTNNNRNMWPANTNIKIMTNRKQQGNKKPQQITKKMNMQRNKQPNNKYTKQQQIHRHSLIPYKKNLKRQTPPLWYLVPLKIAFSYESLRGIWTSEPRFIGIILLPIIGNAAEHYTAIKV